VPVSPIPSRSSPAARHRRNVVPPEVPRATVRLLATTAPFVAVRDEPPDVQNDGRGANPSATVVGSAAHVNRIDVSIGFPDIECIPVVRGSETRASLSPGRAVIRRSLCACNPGRRDSVCPATYRVARVWLRAAREVGSAPLVDDGPGGGRFLSGSDHDLRRPRARVRGHPQPGTGKFHDRTLC
jgi:hypothetical protein